MRKFLSIVFLVCMVFSLSIYSVGIDRYEKDIEFIEDTQFTEYEKKLIIDHLNGLESSNNIFNTDNIICDIIGHNYTTETVYETIHYVYAEAPRCLKKVYEVSVCTRCSNTVSTFLSQQRINCH